MTKIAKTATVHLLATKRGTVAHLPGCRHTGKAELVGIEERELHTLMYARDVADCLHTAAWAEFNALGAQSPEYATTLAAAKREAGIS